MNFKVNNYLKYHTDANLRIISYQFQHHTNNIKNSYGLRQTMLH